MGRKSVLIYLRTLNSLYSNFWILFSSVNLQLSILDLGEPVLASQCFLQNYQKQISYKNNGLGPRSRLLLCPYSVSSVVSSPCATPTTVPLAVFCTQPTKPHDVAFSTVNFMHAHVHGPWTSTLRSRTCNLAYIYGHTNLSEEYPCTSAIDQFERRNVICLTLNLSKNFESNRFERHFYVTMTLKAMIG